MKLVGNVLFFSFENKVRVVAVLPPCFVLLGKTLERNHFHGRNWFLLFLFTAFRNEKKNESYEAENHTKSICLSMSVVPSFTVFSIVFDSNGILVAVSSTVQRKFGYSRFDYGRFPSGSTRPPSCSVNKKKKLGKNSVHHRGPISVRWLSPTSITLPVRIGQKMKLNDDCRFSTFTDKRKDAITQKSCDFPHLIV